jgi:hypothetical protein
MRLHNINYSAKFKTNLIKIRLRLICIIFFAIINNTLFSQSTDTIFHNFKKIELHKIDSVVNFNTEKNKYKYLALMPSVSYDVLNSSFNVGVNVANLSNYFQQKQRTKIELEKLRFQLLQQQQDEIENLGNKYELLINDFEFLKIEIQNSVLDQELFNLKKAQYDNNKINLEEWLNIQKNHQNASLLLFAKRKNLMTRMKQFQLKIKNSCLEQELNFLSLLSN